jgi:hypothetical protein
MTSTRVLFCDLQTYSVNGMEITDAMNKQLFINYFRMQEEVHLCDITLFASSSLIMFIIYFITSYPASLQN